MDAKLRAPDPWKSLGEKIDPTSTAHIKGSEILLDMAEKLGNWPRENTALTDINERHLRFVLTVAGYPEIDVATRPLDWPLNPASVSALEISKRLDDITGARINTSLRSSILNRDLNMRTNNQDDNVNECHQDCLLLLFARLRQIDNRSLDDQFFRHEELVLLSKLHSNVKESRDQDWPDLKKLNQFSVLAPGKRSDFPSGEEIGGLRHSEDETENFEKYKALEKSFNRTNKFAINNDLQTITFQFHYVQSWLNKLRWGDKFNGTVQRFTRGYSVILELLTSEVLQRVAKEIGIGSVTIHGGGRVSFLCPKNLVSKMLEKLDSSSEEFLHLNKSEAANSSRLKSTLEKWSRACLEAGQTRDGGSEKADQKDREEWFKQLRGFLPPISIGVSSEEINEPKDRGEVVNLLNNIPKPVVTQHNRSKDCILCNDMVDSDQENKIDSWMGRLDHSKATKQVCPSHRLLYFIGNDQRIKDSTLRTGSDQFSSKKDDGNARKVTSIVMLDGNSLGVIFKEIHNYDTEENKLDRIRRRSFRFNFLWWSSLSRLLGKYGAGDKLAAWITAGDDVLIAQYESVSSDQTEGRIKKFIEELAKEIDVDLDEDRFLSFGAGIAEREPGSGIISQINRANELEKIAKIIWKNKAKMEWPAMLKSSVGNENLNLPNCSKQNCICKIESKDAWIEDTRSVLLTKNIRHNSDFREKKLPGNDVELSQEELTMSVVEKALEGVNTTTIGIDDWAYLRRGFFVKNSNGDYIRWEILDYRSECDGTE